MNAEQLACLTESVLRLREDAHKLHEYVSGMLFADSSSDAIRARLGLANVVSNCADTIRALKEVAKNGP